MDNERIYNSYRRSLTVAGRSSYTLKGYRTSYDAFIRITGARLEEITRADLETFLEVRMTEVKPVTVDRDYRNLRALINWLLVEEWLPVKVSPLARVSPPEFDPGMPRILTEKELKALLRACAGTRFIDRRDEAMVRLASECGGGRRGEMLSQTVDSVDWRHDLVKFAGKTGERWIPIGTRTMASLDRYMKSRARHRHADLEALWLTGRGAMPIGTFRDILLRRAAKAGIGEIHPHTLRHTAAHRAMEAGMSSSDLETLFGWTPGSVMPGRVYGRTLRVSRAHNASRSLSLGDRL
jgi:site-specific recombinase XerD